VVGSRRSESAEVLKAATGCQGLANLEGHDFSRASSAESLNSELLDNAALQTHNPHVASSKSCFLSAEDGCTWAPRAHPSVEFGFEWFLRQTPSAVVSVGAKGFP
jgi:hypothetical protein